MAVDSSFPAINLNFHHSTKKMSVLHQQPTKKFDLEVSIPSNRTCKLFYHSFDLFNQPENISSQHVLQLKASVSSFRGAQKFFFEMNKNGPVVQIFFNVSMTGFKQEGAHEPDASITGSLPLAADSSEEIKVKLIDTTEHHTVTVTEYSVKGDDKNTSYCIGALLRNVYTNEFVYCKTGFGFKDGNSSDEELAPFKKMVPPRASKIIVKVIESYSLLPMDMNGFSVSISNKKIS